MQLSIIVPVYNAEQYLDRCIQSILTQKFQDFELILVDDGSPDNCPLMCANYQKSNDKIKVIHQSNSGVAAARNTGIEHAEGEYITFVDSDDYLDTNMYSEMMSIAEKYNCDVVMCDCIKEFNNRSEIYTHNIRSGYYNREQLQNEYYPHLIIMPGIEYPPTISNCLCIFKNHMCTENPLRYVQGIRYSEDLLFGAQMMYQADSFYYMKGQAFYHYNCQNILSATHTFKADKWNDYIHLYRCLKESFGNEDAFDFSEQIDKALLFFIYNAVGDISHSNTLDKKQKMKLIKHILSEQEVRAMFSRINIPALPITFKLKILTFIYKYRIGLNILSTSFN